VLGSRVAGAVKSCLESVAVSVESDLGMECSLPGVDKAGGVSCGIVVERSGGLSNWAKISSSSAHCSSTYMSNDQVSRVLWSRFGVKGAVKVVLGGGSVWVVVVGWSGEGVSGAGACNRAVSQHCSIRELVVSMSVKGGMFGMAEVITLGLCSVGLSSCFEYSVLVVGMVSVSRS